MSTPDHGDYAELYAQGEANVAGLAERLRELRATSPELAGRKWAATLMHLTGLLQARLTGVGAPDAVAALELSRSLGDLYLREVIDEVEAELEETPADQAVLSGLLRRIERNAEEGIALADALFRAALDHIQAVRSPS